MNSFLQYDLQLAQNLQRILKVKLFCLKVEVFVQTIIFFIPFAVTFYHKHAFDINQSYVDKVIGVSFQPSVMALAVALLFLSFSFRSEILFFMFECFFVHSFGIPFAVLYFSSSQKDHQLDQFVILCLLRSHACLLHWGRIICFLGDGLSIDANCTSRRWCTWHVVLRNTWRSWYAISHPWLFIALFFLIPRSPILCTIFLLALTLINLNMPSLAFMIVFHRYHALSFLISILTGIWRRSLVRRHKSKFMCVLL